VRPEHAEAKNHPVNGFSAPRAGGGTVPVPPGIPPSPPNAKGTPKVSLLYFRKREGGNRRVRPEHAEAKNHPVNGFSAPRAGGGTAPVPPGIPPSPPNAKGTPKGVSFVFLRKREGGIRRVRPEHAGKYFKSSNYFTIVSVVFMTRRNNMYLIRNRNGGKVCREHV